MSDYVYESFVAESNSYEYWEDNSHKEIRRGEISVRFSDTCELEFKSSQFEVNGFSYLDDKECKKLYEVMKEYYENR